MKKGIRVALNMSSQVGSLCLAEKSGGGGAKMKENGSA